MGVGLQGRPGHLFDDPYTHEFLKASLSASSGITVRDSLSKHELEKAVRTEVTLLPDLVFSFAAYHSYYKTKPITARNSVTFVGEIFSERLSFFGQIFKNGLVDEFFRVFDASDIQYCIMSNDDLSHCDRFVKLMTSRGVACKVHDLRAASISDALDCFRSTVGAVTTRFHGLVLSIISGCPVLAVDVSYGKHALLLKDFFPSIKRNLIDESNKASEILDKLKTLISMPTSILPDIREIEAACTATSTYSSILKDLLDHRVFPEKCP